MHVLSLCGRWVSIPQRLRRGARWASSATCVTWRGCGPPEVTQPLSSPARSSPASTGRSGRSAPTSARIVRGIVDRLLAEQLSGRRLELRGRQRLDAVVVQHHDLRARSPARIRTGRRSSPEVTGARLRGQEYLLERRLFRRRSTGEVIERDRKGGAAWTRFAFPTWWHYDVLRGSSTCAAPASRPTSAWPRRSTWCVEARRRRPVAARDAVPRQDAGRDE
jgi:hypothetical protein